MNQFTNKSANKLKSYTILGVIFVLITGTLAHFVYDWSGRQFLLGLFFPVSESTWEHMKLVFFPMSLYAWYMNKKLSPLYPCIGSSLLLGILAGTFLIPVFFYTYSGVLGRNITFLDILTFVVSVLAGFAVTYRLTLSCRLSSCLKLWKILVLLTAAAFFLFTYLPPSLGIFNIPS